MDLLSALLSFVSPCCSLFLSKDFQQCSVMMTAQHDSMTALIPASNAILLPLSHMLAHLGQRGLLGKS